MSLRSIIELRKQPVLIDAATAACMVAAQDVLAEDANTSNHVNRIAWANRNPDANAKEMMLSVCMNTSVQTKWAERAALNVEEVLRYDDGDIQFIINSNIDRFATG
jgi:hypothetical protein